MTGTKRAILVHAKDTVATALEALPAGDRVRVEGVGDAPDREIELLEPIAFGHKFALADLQAGADVIKYGESIGRATQSIPPGAWVHVHNIESTRGRGDLAPSEGAA